MINPVAEKIDKIFAGGQTAFQDGTVKLFTGFLETLKYRMNTAAVIDTYRSRTLQELLHKLREAAESLGLRPLTAGYDYPPHMTILEGLPGEAKLQDVAGLQVALEEFFGSTPTLISPLCPLSFNRLFVNGSGDVLLMANQIQTNVGLSRKHESEIFQKAGFKPLELADIMHMSLQRIWNGNIPPDSLKDYWGIVKQIAAGLGNQMTVIVKKVYVGPALGLLQGTF